MRDRIADRWNKTQQQAFRSADRRVYYLSLEYLIGRLLDDAMLSLGITGEARAALADLGIDVAELAKLEDDAGLGNGGLGRLAACFLDSMATLGISAVGYGIRYEYGIFRQAIVNGEQVEQPDNWLLYPNPWEIARPERLFPVQLRRTRRRSTRTAAARSSTGSTREDVHGHGVRHAGAGLSKRRGEHPSPLVGAGRRASSTSPPSTAATTSRPSTTKTRARTSRACSIPNDNVAQGRELRLRQEFFFVSATLQDAIRRHLSRFPTVKNLHEAAVFQLNDTHPAVAVAELMRLLLDEHELGWDEAWSITSRAFAYTNHTVLPEALEQWPVSHVRPRPAAAPPDRLRDQPPLPRRGARAVPGRRGPRAPDVAHRGGTRAEGADGASGDRRERRT